MKAGNLVQINRASLGVPHGSVGLILKMVTSTQDTLAEEGFGTAPLTLCVVLLHGGKTPRTYMPRDLEVLS
jgi:hypothetical protein